MKKIVKKIIYNKNFARRVIKSILRMHSLTNVLADTFSIAAEGIHPKHRILNYEKWFLEKIEKGWIVLDIGSNTGLMASLLAEKAGFVYGIEIKKELIDEADSKRKKANIEYLCADAEKFEFSGLGNIDCVILSNVLEHIENRTLFLKDLIKRINWRNPERKIFLFRVPMINRDWIVLYKKELGVEYRSDKTHFTEYTLETFKNELEGAGIEILDSEVRFGEIYAVSQGG